MLWIPIDRSLDISLMRQIYQHIRKQILNGNLKSGEKVPSSRELASNLNVSRNVILDAYDQLSAEGFLVSQMGSGTYIAEGTLLTPQKKTSSSQILNQYQDKKNHHNMIDFRSGIPALDLFPSKT